MRITESFKIDRFKHDRKIIIYGAGTCGEIALRGLEKYGLKPDFFCDRSLKHREMFGIPVIEPKELPGYRDALILLASLNYFYEMIDMCNQLECRNYYDIEEIMKLHIPDEYLSFQAQDVLTNRARYIDVIHHGQDEDRLCIGKLEINVSEACSLKCKDCSYLMQYYQHPENADVEQMINTLDRLLAVVDRVSEFRLLGGEPFMNKDLYKIVEAYHDNKKVGIIDIHTNGTVIPSQKMLGSLKYDNVIVHISDYDVRTNKIDKLKLLFDQQGIRYFIRKYDAWKQYGAMKNRNYSEQEVQKVFASCTSRNCYTLKGSKLFRCPRSAHATALNMIPDYPGDYIDVLNELISNEKLKMEIKKFLSSNHYLEACRYCINIGEEITEVQAAIQTDKPFEYLEVKKYNKKMEN